MPTDLNTILSWFQTGDYPTQEQFQNSWSSFWHLEDKLPISSITNLESSLQNKVDKSIYNAHLTSSDAHSTTLAKLDGSNLNYLNVQVWKDALGVGELPSNIALIDDPANTLQGNVWTKTQSNALYMLLEDFVISGKIRADKIEALGLTELIAVTETSLSAFMTNNANYQYEKNDFIAIPDGAGNYSLYIYKGGSKTVAGNYIATGLSTINISMVQGLQTALDNKLDKPSGNGSFFVNRNGAVSSYRIINPSSNYLLYWNGTDFTSSDIYNIAGKYGIGTTSPTEMLHLNNGRIRSKANVLDENNETLINQITTYNRKLLFTDSTGTKKTVLTVEDLPTEFMALPSKLTPAQKNTWFAQMNSETSFSGTSVIVAVPPVVTRSDIAQNLIIKGLGLNLVTNFDVTPAENRSYVGVFPDLNNDGIQQPGEVDIPAQNYSRVGDDQTVIAQFLFNSSTPVGKYKLKVKNAGIPAIGDAYIHIVDSLELMPNFQTFIKQYNNASSPAVNTNGTGSFNIKSDGSIRPLLGSQMTTEIIAVGYTSQLLGSDDWMFDIVVGDVSSTGGIASDNYHYPLWFGFTQEDGNNISVGDILFSQAIRINQYPSTVTKDMQSGGLFSEGAVITGGIKITYIKLANILNVIAEYVVNGVSVSKIYTGYIDTTKNYRFKWAKNGSKCINEQTIFISNPKLLNV